MEIKAEVKTYKVDYLCDECKVGYMRPTGRAFPTHPMKFQHKCTNCENTKTFLEAYPVTRYENIITPEEPKKCNFYISGNDTSGKCLNCGKPNYYH